MSLTVQTDIDSVKKLDSYIARVKRYGQTQRSKGFQEFIKDKVMNTLVETMGERLQDNNTNSDFISLYWASNHIVDTQDGKGFILYNDAKIPANVNGVQNIPENYPEGMFSIALAFEYGVGIVGMTTDYDGTKYSPWEYNVQDYNFGWYLPKDVRLQYGIPKNYTYMGYEGYEVYRYTADKVEKRLPKWVQEYFDKKEV